MFKLTNETRLSDLINVDPEELGKIGKTKMAQMHTDVIHLGYSGMHNDHTEEMSVIADTLQARIGRIIETREVCKYRKEPLKMTGNIVDGFRLSREDFTAPYNDYEGTFNRDVICLQQHYQQHYGRLPFSCWQNLTPKNATMEIVKNLRKMTGLNAWYDFCVSCPICFHRLLGWEEFLKDMRARK